MNEGEAPRLRAAALNLLARREHSRDELRRKLLASGYSSAFVETELHALATEGLQSDRRYGEIYLAQRAARGFGPERIAPELRQRGLDPEQVDELIDGCGVDWCQRAAQVRAKKFGVAVPDEFPERARQIRFLAYRGFAGAQIDAALESGE
ncbi:MAG: regulatory protein RecX [Gammaproteobacteria bacterium]|nr:regulatory protein RecX [Gammaproteobacteria bacterium]